MAHIVRYRLSYMRNLGSTEYTQSRKEFRSLTQALEFASSILSEGGTVSHLRKWVQTSFSPQERELVERLSEGKIKP